MKFYTAEWNVPALSLIFIVLIVILGFSFNVPIGQGVQENGTILSMAVTHGSKVDFPYPTARIELSTGKKIDVIIPRGVNVRTDQRIVVIKQRLFLKGTIYKYGHIPNHP